MFVIIPPLQILVVMPWQLIKKINVLTCLQLPLDDVLVLLPVVLLQSSELSHGLLQLQYQRSKLCGETTKS